MFSISSVCSVFLVAISYAYFNYWLWNRQSVNRRVGKKNYLLLRHWEIKDMIEKGKKIKTS